MAVVNLNQKKVNYSSSSGFGCSNIFHTFSNNIFNIPTSQGRAFEHPLKEYFILPTSQGKVIFKKSPNLMTPIEAAKAENCALAAQIGVSNDWAKQ